jgi:CubicO group peptidase (beta-lactamase class C family)
LSNQETLYPADSLFQYSNLGLSLAGEIVSHHAGTSYEEYVQERILGPLVMTDTRPFFPEELHGKQMAIGYSSMTRDLKRKPLKPFHTSAITPAAGFTSTVNDLAKFASWNFRTLAGDGGGVLDPNTLREMHRVHWVDPDWKTTWGLGFVVINNEGTTVVGHSGGCPGYITNLSMVPKHKIGSRSWQVIFRHRCGPTGPV